MKRFITISAALIACSGALAAHAAGQLAEVAILDRDTGAPLQTHYYRGEYWVAGRPGAHYAIYLRNRVGERLLAVTSVDGVNVVSGQTASWNQSGYVLSAGEIYQITGWRKSDYEVAEFAFAPTPSSYAARTGRPENVGVIGVAVFREMPVAYAPPSDPAITARENSRAQSAAKDAAAAGAASAPQFAANSESVVQPAARAPALGTAHGERESSYVAHTSFVRMQPEPNEIIHIRYDSLDNLIAMGVIRQPRYAPTRLNPFPGSAEQQYVPDPPPG